ncbi:hypothetical protein R1flu_007816 [Riccia fluitans]|uniref:Uncharacterized protein n=1 Tax=Riccia fluitans TaxID=41844 RepID=A0ABD1Z434_9MARC
MRRSPFEGKPSNSKSPSKRTCSRGNGIGGESSEAEFFTEHKGYPGKRGQRSTGENSSSGRSTWEPRNFERQLLRKLEFYIHTSRILSFFGSAPATLSRTFNVFCITFGLWIGRFGRNSVLGRLTML